ncbi:MAG: Na/Pi cotransporter family protein [Alphaproteobacteria bacterium]|nr:Na/Pi cotransporter family protein [Alphaproteobacteria bacterium]
MTILINIVGSIALLLWGIRMVRTAVTRGFGAELRAFLSRALKNRLQAFATGIGVTTLLQSSTATALIIASFANSGILGGAIALTIMLGADVGTTLVVQIFSQRIEWLGPLLLALGVIGFFSSERARSRNIGRGLIGLGLIMLALKSIAVAAQPVATSAVVQSVLSSIAGEPLLAIVIVAAITVLIHSSVAMVLLIGSFAATGALSLGEAVAMVLGANLGGALLPVIATWVQPAAARVAPLANAFVRTVGVTVALLLIAPFTDFIASLGAGPAYAVAHAHTIFNLLIALVALPFVASLSDLTARLFPMQHGYPATAFRSSLEQAPNEAPAVAIAGTTREALRMGDIIEEMLERSIAVFRDDDSEQRKYVTAKDDEVDKLHEAIKIYIARLLREDLDEADHRRSHEILSFTTNLEHIGDIIDKNLMELAAKKKKAKATFSEEGLRELEAFHRQVQANMRKAINVFITGDRELARQLLQCKTALRDKERQSIECHYQRIGCGTVQSIETSSIHLDILRDLKRINSHLTAVAYPILERSGELAATRLRDSDAA